MHVDNLKLKLLKLNNCRRQTKASNAIIKGLFI